MTWFKVDDSFYDHPKVFDAPDCAVALWTRAGTWSARNLTDGFVPANLPARLCDDPDTAVRELTDRGLWRRAKGGYRFHDWTEYQPTADKVQELKRKRAEAGRKGGESKAAKQNTGKSQASATLAKRSKAEFATEFASETEVEPVDIADETTDTGPAETWQTASKCQASASGVAKQNAAPYPYPTRITSGHLGEGGSPTERAGHPPPSTNDTEVRPAARCERHADVDDPPPCGQCADARRAAEAWDAEQPRRDAAARSAEARRRAELRAAEIAACRMCDDAGYAGTRVCDHDPQRADVAARGAAAARAALAERRAS